MLVAPTQVLLLQETDRLEAVPTEGRDSTRIQDIVIALLDLLRRHGSATSMFREPPRFSQSRLESASTALS